MTNLFAITYTPDINLGTIIAAIVLLFTFYRFHIANVKRIEQFAHRTTLLWADFCKRHGLQIEDE